MPTSARLKPPLGDQGEVAGRRPDGGDQNRQKPEQTIPQSRFASQLPLHKGACPLRRRGWQRSARVHATRRCGTGGHKGRPYAPLCGVPKGRTGWPPGSRPPRRSRCPHRPASPRVRGSPPSAPFPAHVVGADCISARNPVRYLPGPGGCGDRARTRHARPYGGCGRRWCVRRSGAARAAMKAAPTPRFLFSRRGGLYGRPEAGALRQGSMVPPRRGVQISKIGAAAIGNSPLIR